MDLGKSSAEITVSVLYTDIEGHTAKQRENETEAERAERNEKVRRLIAEIDEVVGALNLPAGWPVRSFTGDGEIITFEGDPTSAAQCAVALSKRLQRFPDLKVRMGINTGLAARETNSRGEIRFMGPALDLGKRVLDFGDGNHILLSRAAADSITDDSLRGCCHDLGEAEAKHGRWIPLQNLHGTGFGNPEVPNSLPIANFGWRRPAGLRLSRSRPELFAGIADLLRWLLLAPSEWAADVFRITRRQERDFTLLELSPVQVRSNCDVRELLARCGMIGLLSIGIILLVFSIFGNELRMHPGFFATVLALFGMLLALIVGVGASLAFFVLTAVGQVVRQIAAALWGEGRLPEMLVVAITQFLLIVVLAPLLQKAALKSKRREIAAAFMASFVAFFAFFGFLAIALAASPQLFADEAKPRWLVGLAAGFVIFLTMTILTGARAGWARAYVAASITGVVYGIIYAVSFFTVGDPSEVERMMPRDLSMSWAWAIGIGASTAIFAAVAGGIAFICGRLFADAVAGVVAMGLVTCLVILTDHAAKQVSGSGALTVWHLLPIPAVLLGWIVARSRNRNNASALATRA